MKNMYKLNVGDWSNDGHGKNEVYYFKTNKNRSEIIKAYKKFEKEVGIGLTHNAKIEILNKYEDNAISLETFNKLKSAGMKFDYLECQPPQEEFNYNIEISPDDVFHIFMEMVRLRLSDFEYELIKDEVQSINGFWSKDFNEGIGYGVFL